MLLRIQTKLDTFLAVGAESSEISEEVLGILAKAPSPLRARQIAKRLSKTGEPVRRKQVNAVLYGELRGQVVRNERKEWRLAENVVPPQEPPPTVAHPTVNSATSTPSQRRDWTQDEARVLVAIYFVNDYEIGDGDRDQCKKIALELSRPASSIDRQWRNIASVTKGSTNRVGSIVVSAVHWYNQDPVRGTQYAREICTRRSWDLGSLLVQPAQTAADNP